MRSLPEQERRRRRALRNTQWVAKNPDKRKKTVRNHNWKAQGILNENSELFSYADYDTILVRQSGRCRICFVSADQLAKGLVVDHDHATQKVRGLLCDNCNVGLGRFRDDLLLLQNATRYLAAR